MCSMLHMHRPLPTRCRSRQLSSGSSAIWLQKKAAFHRFSKTKRQALLESGYAYKIPELRIKKRETQGLPPLPKGNPESVNKSPQRRKILRANTKTSRRNTKWPNSKYLIFLGCAIPYRVSAYEISSRKVLAKLGVELVEMPEFNCCGLPLTQLATKPCLFWPQKTWRWQNSKA